MNKKVLIIIIAVVLVVGIGVAAFFLLPGILNDDAPTVREAHYYPFEDYFVVNVKDGNGMLFKATVILVADTDEIQETVSANEYLIRDRLLFLFRSLTTEDIQSQDIQERLREEIPAMINEMLGVNNFYSVLFGDFVMQ